MEYKCFAKYYDLFYKNKDYQKETTFLSKIIKPYSTILDAGCGTGIHASLLEKMLYQVDILDLNQEMLNIAKTRNKGKAYHQNILNLNIDKNYDAIISMFAVVNHLKDLNELEIVLNNFKNHIKENGIIIIDLHNPQKSGQKEDYINNMKRIMIWEYNPQTHIEKSKIIFKINKKEYIDNHEFRIFNINEMEKICKKLGLIIKNIYENYQTSEGSNISKNLQFIIKKEQEL